MKRLYLLVGAAWVAFGVTAVEAQISDDIVKIGVPTDLSGPASVPTGRGSVTAAEMAVEDFGKTVASKPIEVISADHQIKPDLGSSIARRWYDAEQVDLIVDVPVSAVGLAVQVVANEKKKLMITHSTGTSDFTGKHCSPYTMQWVFDTHALAVGTAREVVKRGGDTWFFVTADYAFGHSLEADASGVIEENGGKVPGSVRHPFAVRDISSFMLQAQASRAKVIGIASGPPDNTNAIRASEEFGIVKGGQQLAGLLFLITDIHEMTLQKAQGLILTTSFYWDMDDKTRAWSERFYDRLGKMPTMWQAGIYSSVMNYLGAIKAIGTDDALSPHRGFLLAARHAAQGRPDGAQPLSRAGEDAAGIEVSLGLLQGAGHHPGRRRLSPARSRLPARRQVGFGAFCSSS